MRNRLIQILLVLFVLISALHLTAVYVPLSSLQMLTKPLLVPLLAIIYLLSSKHRNRAYLVALLSSFIGDVLLMDKDHLFLYGVASFLITQITYVYLFSAQVRNSGPWLLLKSALPFLVYYLFLMTLLLPGLDEYLFPVLIYGIVICIFGSVSLLRYLHHPDRHGLQLLVGALLFILSDSMIALNKFHQERQFYPLAIMFTYILSQYMIMRYVLKSELLPHSGERAI